MNPNLCIVPGKHMGIFFYSMDQEQVKNPDKYGISWNLEYGATNNCTNLHTSLPRQSILIEFFEITISICIFVRLEMQNDNGKKKEIRTQHWELDPAPRPPSQKIER